MFLSYCIFPL